MTKQGLPDDPLLLYPNPARILVVDDESLIAETIELALTEEGYDVEISCNGSDALSLLLKNQALLILGMNNLICKSESQILLRL